MAMGALGAYMFMRMRASGVITRGKHHSADLQDLEDGLQALFYRSSTSNVHTQGAASLRSTK